MEITEEESEKLATTSEYNATSIKVLDGLDAVRKRPAMYIGDTSTAGLHHLVYEVVDNAIDEALAGRCKNISVTIKQDGSVSVRDDGHGIPVDIHQETGLPAVEVVMTTLHAGGKFDNNAYKVSGGLHGVGVSCVNALSEVLKVKVFLGGKIHFMEFRDGEKVEDLKVIGETDRHGTEVTFKPSPKIFDDVVFSYETIAKRMRELAFLTSGVRIKVAHEVLGKEDIYQYEGGIKAFVKHINQNKAPMHPEVIYMTKTEGNIEVELAMQYVDGYSENVYSFVNTINTHEGGTHVSGFRSALTRTLNQYAKNEKFAKDEKLPSGDDYREGLTAVLSVKLPDPQFESQTKIKLGNREVQGIVESIVNETLGTYLEENPSVGKVIISKALLASRAREAARKARDLVQRKGALASGNLPGKLADCSLHEVDKSEIYIVEGDSAGGTAKMSRDRRYQAILPIRGKILNVEKARVDKMLAHAEIETIVQALGTGIGQEAFDISKVRYGKIIIMTDADVDGSHIRTLLLTFFFRHMTPLVENGYIYIAQPPLYRIKRKKQQKYVLSEREMNRTLLDLGVEGTVLRTPAGEFEGESLSEVLGDLSKMEEYVLLSEKKGMDFDDYLGLERDGKFPMYKLSRNGEPLFLYSEAEYDDFLESLEKELGREPKVFSFGAAFVPTGDEDIEVTEIPEAKSIKQIILNLEKHGFTQEDFVLNKGGKGYTVISEGNENDVENIRSILEVVRNIGAQGMEITRYKGLGEMNPDQLWETTMDPERRTLLKVKLEDAIRADMIFTILMGSNVEPRREFIEKFALEVKNLDV